MICKNCAYYPTVDKFFPQQAAYDIGGEVHDVLDLPEGLLRRLQHNKSLLSALASNRPPGGRATCPPMTSPANGAQADTRRVRQNMRRIMKGNEV